MYSVRRLWGWTIVFVLAASFGSAVPEKKSPATDPVRNILRQLYPDATRIQRKFVYLTKKEQREVQRRARVPIRTRLFKFYRLYRDDTWMADAAVDTHILRTHYETLLVVITPGGEIDRIEILAFEEPPDYRPSQPWLERLHRQTLNDDLWIGRSVPNITGATITAQAIVRSVRTLLAVWEIAFAPRQED